MMLRSLFLALVLLPLVCLWGDDAPGPSPAPGPDWTWEGGHWENRNGQQLWVEGRYIRLPPKPAVPAAPPPGMVWLPGRWNWAGNEWRWAPGHYEAVAAAAAAPSPPVAMAPPEAQIVVVQGVPPPPRAEDIPVCPDQDTVWIAGHWTWNANAWIWIGGVWSHPPRPHAVWVEPNWEHHHDREWRYSPGHWR